MNDRTRATLARLHLRARRDAWTLLKAVPLFLWSLLTGRSLMKVLTPKALGGAYIPVSREQGEWLYLTARAMNARRIVEFGSSFGISTLYLAAAAHENGGQVVTTEIVPQKCRATEAALREAGLEGSARVLEGDALETLKQVEGPIDLVFLDGWKDLYVAVLELLKPKLRTGAVVIADNVNLKDAKPYVAHVRASGFQSATLFRGGTELSLFAGHGE